MYFKTIAVAIDFILGLLKKHITMNIFWSETLKLFVSRNLYKVNRQFKYMSVLNVLALFTNFWYVEYIFWAS